jgi:hypothetical protein
LEESGAVFIPDVVHNIIAVPSVMQDTCAFAVAAEVSKVV